MRDPQDGRDECPGVADADEEDEIDKIEGPRNGMPHPGLSEAFDELPGKGEKGPEKDEGQRGGYDPKKLSRDGPEVLVSDCVFGRERHYPSDHTPSFR